MKKNRVANQALDIMGSLGIEVSIQKEIVELVPPVIGSIADNEDLIAVSDGGVTEELPLLDGDLELESPLPDEFPEGLYDVIRAAEEIRDKGHDADTNRRSEEIHGPIRVRAHQKNKSVRLVRSDTLFWPKLGIYIREECLKGMMLDVLHRVDWKRTSHIALPNLVLRMRNSCFYYVYFHEQFHHKVESLGLRTLLASQRDAYLRLIKFKPRASTRIHI